MLRVVFIKLNALQRPSPEKQESNLVYVDSFTHLMELLDCFKLSARINTESVQSQNLSNFCKKKKIHPISVQLKKYIEL